jgi:asparagine synthase (glutamine-hydrolysing)
MCGICGVIGVNDPRASEPILRRMLASLIHRGPDDEGALVAPGAALGMRRLSIIDLAGGAQPIWNEAGTLAIVFNGEIYNYRELRRQLEAAGHSFRTQSDTEVIVHGYEKWGADCATHLRGMFEFAIAELPAGRGASIERVFIARDRMGIKPLYYAIADGGVLVFASEVRALLASGLIAREIAPEAVASYVLFGSVCEPETLVAGVRSLPPGHRVTISSAAPVAAISPESYWSPRSASTAASGRSQSAASGISPARRLRALLEDSVEKHLIADVPIGVFLSSGIDSTALTALASQQRAGLHTFTLIFPEREFSEAEIARRTAKRFHTDHQELLIGGDEMLARMDEAVGAFDQPSMDGINTYFVSWAARQAGLKVALSGLGSDEIFGGYSTFRTAPRLARIAHTAAMLPSGLRHALAPFAGALVAGLNHADAGRKFEEAWRDPGSFPDAYFFARAVFTPAQALGMGIGPARLQQGEWKSWIDDVARVAHQLGGASGVSWLELRTYMVNTLLCDTDAMSMRSSLEVRVPFLDHPVVEFALSLTDAEKKIAQRPKGLLIEALADLLPEEVVTQRKRTFTLPWETWLRGALRERVAAGFAQWPVALEPVLPQQSAQRVWIEFLAGRTSWSRAWSLYVLQDWVKRNLENAEPQTAREHGAATAIPARLT